MSAEPLTIYDGRHKLGAHRTQRDAMRDVIKTAKAKGQPTLH